MLGGLDARRTESRLTITPPHRLQRLPDLPLYSLARLIGYDGWLRILALTNAMSPFPAEHELIGLFESEPIVELQKVPWAYNHLTFVRTIGENTLHCELEPGYETLKFRWVQRDVELVNLDLHWVSGITIETKPGMEVLVVHCRNRAALLPLKIQFRPTVQVTWGTSREFP